MWAEFHQLNKHFQIQTCAQPERVTLVARNEALVLKLDENEKLHKHEEFIIEKSELRKLHQSNTYYF